MNELEFKEKMEKLDTIIAEHKDMQGGLMPVLHETQGLFGYLPEEAQKKISEGLNVPLAEIYGVATFYSRFTLEPKGEHTISVCLGTACYVKGVQEIYKRLQDELNVKPGQTTKDNKFTLIDTRCLGCCGLAPVLTVDEEVYGKLKPDDIPEILAKYA